MEVIAGPTRHDKDRVGIFDETWTLLALPERTKDQLERMIHCSHAAGVLAGYRFASMPSAARRPLAQAAVMPRLVPAPSPMR